MGWESFPKFCRRYNLSQYPVPVVSLELYANVHGRSYHLVQGRRAVEFSGLRGMGFRRRRNRTNRRDQHSFAASTAAIALLLEILLWRSSSSSLSTSFFCHGRKDPSSPSSSWKPSKISTTATATPVLLGTRSNQNRIAAWVPRQAFGSNQAHRNINHRSVPCVGYYIPSHTSTCSGRCSSSALFSRNRGVTDNVASDADDDEEEDDDKQEKIGVGNNDNNGKKGVLSVLGSVQYGMNRVHEDFLGLSWKVYSQTFLYTAPFVVLLFIVLPALSTSSSPSLRLLANKVQGSLRWTFDVLAEGSRLCFVRPMHALVQWVVSWGRSGGSAVTPKSAWRSRSSKINMLVWGLVWGPIVEEFIFRFAFRRVWKVLFRPIAIGSNNNINSKSKTRNYSSDHSNTIADPDNVVLVAPSYVSLLTKILSALRRTPHQDQKPKPRYTNQSWRIASGICFGIAHFSNFFPIDLDQYTLNGKIRLPCGTVRERFLLGLFPGDFASHPSNSEFCLVSMVLTGAVYQSMHCFINTMILYGPLLDSTKSSQFGGIFAAIGAHIAWNTNVLWLVTNLKLRLLFKLVAVPLFQSQKRQQKPSEASDEINPSGGDHK